MTTALDLAKQHPVETITALALLVGTLGNVIADSVDGEAHPRLYQFGRFLQNIGIALPKAMERLACFVKAIRGHGKPPSSGSPPVPPAAGSTPLLALVFVLAVGLLTQAACHGGRVVSASPGQTIRIQTATGFRDVSVDDLALEPFAKATP